MHLRNTYLLTLALSVAGVFAAAGQDLQFSQYYQAPLYLNPGFTGITPQQRAVFNHRVQWPNLPQAFVTYAASYDIFVEELRSGFGVLLTTDKMGSAGWRSSMFNFLYSYKVKLTENLVFSPGLYFAYGTNGIDRTRLRLGDGLEFERDGQYYSIDPDQDKIGRQSYFDTGAGMLLYTRKMWLGFAMSHLNQPNLSVLGDVSRLPMKGNVHLGMRLNLSEGGLNPSTYRISYLTPSVMFRWQGKSFTQMDMGINYHIDPVSVGIWYRGKPWQKTVSNSVAQDAAILQLGLYMKNLTIGYSYDFTISEIQTTSGGSHEISLVYEFSAKLVPAFGKEKIPAYSLPYL